MAKPSGLETPDTKRGSPIAEASRLFHAATKLESHHDKTRYHEALKAFLAFVEAHRKGLHDGSSDIAVWLDETGVAFYRGSNPELARRAVELGLELAPESPSLLHHKAIVLLAQNRDIEQVLPLLDSATEANPHDKTLWATRGDALKFLKRPQEAADAYLRAQQLDATSTQYVDRALKLTPHNPAALRMKLQLAKALGGDRQALWACDELLAGSPEDPELLVARAELLMALGELKEALEPLQKARSLRAEDNHIAVVEARLLLSLGKDEESILAINALLTSSHPLDPIQLNELAQALEAKERDLPTALAIRIRLREVDPRNLGNLSQLRTLALRLDRPEEALAACRAILEAYPENLEAMRGVAELLLSQGKKEEAFEAYRALVRAHPHDIAEARKALEAAKATERSDLVREFAKAILGEESADVPAQEELAKSLSTSGEKAEAVAVLDNLLRAHPGETRYLLERKQLLTDLNDPEGLRTAYDELFSVDPTRTDVALERGNLYLAQAYDHPEGSEERDAAARIALVSYERSSLDPTSAPQSQLGVARASRLIQDHDRAVQAYRDFLQRKGNEHRTDVLKELGHALRETGRYTEADEVYSQAIQLGLEDPDLFWGEVEVLTLLNEEGKALRFVDLLLLRDPQNPLFLRRKGQLLLKSGRRSEGLGVLKTAVQGAQGDSHVYFETAEALREQGAYADALGYYRKGLDLDPKSRIGRLAYAETLLLAGQYNEVVPLVDVLLKEDPNDLSAWKTRGDAYRSLGRPTELLYSLTAILLLDPHNGPALLEKVRLHQTTGDEKAAFETLTQLIESGGPEGKDAALHLERGDLAARLGRVEDANQSYEKAAEIDPSHLVEIACRRARLRLTAGRPDLALEVLDAGLKEIPEGAEANVSGLLLRAEVLMALERPAEAKAVYEEVLKKEPRSPVALSGVGRALLDEGKHADAREFLRKAIPQIPPSASLFLLTAEAESGLGSFPGAVEVVRRGVEALPKSSELWMRLGELGISAEAWADASNAFAHALALEPSNAEMHLRAGFVAEKLGHPNEALALYEHATQVGPTNKYAWCSRGLALLATGKPEEARASFERSLALDSDFDAAKEGKKAALQKTRETQIERLGREALLLEAKLHRTVTKNDLFVTLHVPFELLEPVLNALGRSMKMDIDRLTEAELHDLESASYHLVTAALDHRPPGIERRGFTLADVAVLSPPNSSLEQNQKLFGYLRAVLEADLRPENLQLTPDVEEMARKALLLPENQRTLFQIVRTLRVGIFKARLIKVVESSGSAVHAPLPTLDLGAYSPEFRSSPPGQGAEGEAYFLPENVPSPGAGAGAQGTETETDTFSTKPALSFNLESGSAAGPRCVGCGGLASVIHSCGAPICQHCIGRFQTCPKCQQPVTTLSSRPVEGISAATPTARRAQAGATAKTGILSLKSVFQRGKSGSGKTESVVHPSHSSDGARSDAESSERRPLSREKGDTGSKPPSASAAERDRSAPPPGARPTHPKEKADDEPRL